MADVYQEPTPIPITIVGGEAADSITQEELQSSQRIIIGPGTLPIEAGITYEYKASINYPNVIVSVEPNRVMKPELWYFMHAVDRIMNRITTSKCTVGGIKINIQYDSVAPDSYISTDINDDIAEINISLEDLLHDRNGHIENVGDEIETIVSDQFIQLGLAFHLRPICSTEGLFPSTIRSTFVIDDAVTDEQLEALSPTKIALGILQALDIKRANPDFSYEDYVSKMNEYNIGLKFENQALIVDRFYYEDFFINLVGEFLNINDTSIIESIDETSNPFATILVITGIIAIFGGGGLAIHQRRKSNIQGKPTLNEVVNLTGKWSGDQIQALNLAMDLDIKILNIDQIVYLLGLREQLGSPNAASTIAYLEQIGLTQLRDFFTLNINAINSPYRIAAEAFFGKLLEQVKAGNISYTVYNQQRSRLPVELREVISIANDSNTNQLTASLVSIDLGGDVKDIDSSTVAKSVITRYGSHFRAAARDSQSAVQTITNQLEAIRKTDPNRRLSLVERLLHNPRITINEQVADTVVYFDVQSKLRVTINLETGTVEIKPIAEN